MEKQFVPYDLAVKLKELGFDEECFRGYTSDGEIADYTNSFKNYNDSLFINAPLWQQAFDWFRGKYNLLAYPVKYIGFYYCIDEIKEKYAESIYLENTETFKTYEQARQACLEKLIELITPKTDHLKSSTNGSI